MSSAVAQLPPAFRSMARQSQTSSPKKTTMTWAEKRKKQALAAEQQQAKAKAAKQGTSQDKPKNSSDLDFDIDDKKSREEQISLLEKKMKKVQQLQQSLVEKHGEKGAQKQKEFKKLSKKLSEYQDRYNQILDYELKLQEEQNQNDPDKRSVDGSFDWDKPMTDSDDDDEHLVKQEAQKKESQSPIEIPFNINIGSDQKRSNHDAAADDASDLPAIGFDIVVGEEEQESGEAKQDFTLLSYEELNERLGLLDFMIQRTFEKGDAFEEYLELKTNRDAVVAALEQNENWSDALQDEVDKVTKAQQERQSKRKAKLEAHAEEIFEAQQILDDEEHRESLIKEAEEAFLGKLARDELKAEFGIDCSRDGMSSYGGDSFSASSSSSSSSSSSTSS